MRANESPATERVCAPQKTQKERSRHSGRGTSGPDPAVSSTGPLTLARPAPAPRAPAHAHRITPFTDRSRNFRLSPMSRRGAGAKEARGRTRHDDDEDEDSRAQLGGSTGCFRATAKILRKGKTVPYGPRG